MSRYWICDDCGEKVAQTDFLVAPHPFKPTHEIEGCPHCQGVDFEHACDEPGCTMTVSCGTPTPEGYRNTCGEHRPHGGKFEVTERKLPEGWVRGDAEDFLGGEVMDDTSWTCSKCGMNWMLPEERGLVCEKGGECKMKDEGLRHERN